MEFLAKSNGVTLKNHSIDVYNKVNNILCNIGITDENILQLSKLSALVHDCGKTLRVFQEYVHGNVKDDDKFPRHNEVGFGLLNFLIDKEYGIFRNKISDLIKYVTLYHHVPYEKEHCLSDLFDVDEINNIAKYYNDIFNECGVSDIIRFRENITEDEFDESGVIIGNNSTFEFINSSDLKESMDFLNVFEIIFNVVRYSDLIISKGSDVNEKRYNENNNSLNLIMPNYFDKIRWDEQIDVATKASNNDITLLSATMGWGKTLLGVRVLLNSDKQGFWVCPDNSLATSTYNSIVNTLNECGGKDIRVALLLSGKWVAYNWETDNISIDDIDIIVTNIDTYVNGITRNARKEISFKSLFSNTIFDEYHEYAFTTSPLLARFLSIINARKKMRNLKTLLLSGTAINKGYIDIKSENIIEAGVYLEKKKMMNIHFISKEEYYSKYLNTPDSLHINTRIQTSQNNFVNGNMDFCFHSLFDDTDSMRILNDISKHNGKYALLDKSNVSSTSVLSRGVDVSFKNAFLINPSPEMIEQIFGRVGNRWDFSIVGDIYIVLDKRRTELMIYNSNNVWEKYYSKYIVHLFNDKTDITISAFDLKQKRLNFFENNIDKKISYKKMIRNGNLVTSLENLSKINFSEGTIISNTENTAKYVKDGMDVRGDSMNRYFIIQKDDEEFGVTSEPINIPSYRFNDNYFIALNNRDIINNVKKYFAKYPDIAKKYNYKKYKKECNLIKDLIDKAKCSETPFPLLCNYGYSSIIGFYRK